MFPDIGPDEVIRPVDRTVYVTLRRKMHDGAGFVLLEQSAHEFAVAHVSVGKDISRIGSDPKQVTRIARVGQLVEIHHRSSFLLDPLQDEVGTDESRPSGHQNRLFHVSRVAPG